MPPVAVEIGPPAARTEPDTFDPDTYVPEQIQDLDALAESAKCSCAASDDNPY